MLTVYYDRAALHIPFLATGAYSLIFGVVGAGTWSALLGVLLGLWDIDLLVIFSTDAESIHSTFFRCSGCSWFSNIKF